LQRPWIGLFDINTRIDCRNRGLAHQLVSALLAWGKTNAAIHAYLQVEENNSPARRLYDKLGFKDNYRYWYRIGTGSNG
jgi:ribosomal protein S18 acetylase RimI-like enzyme